MTGTSRLLWRGIQVLVGLLLLGSLGLLIWSLRSAPGAEHAAPGRARAARHGSDRRVRRLKAALAERSAELEAARTEADALKTSLQRAEERTAPLEGRVLELEARLRELETEREHLARDLDQERRRADEAGLQLRELEDRIAALGAPSPGPPGSDGHARVIELPVTVAEPEGGDVDGLVVEELLVEASALGSGEPVEPQEVPGPDGARSPDGVESPDGVQSPDEVRGPPEGAVEAGDETQAWTPLFDVTPLEDERDGLSLRARLARAAAARHRFGTDAQEQEQPPALGPPR